MRRLDHAVDVRQDGDGEDGQDADAPLQAGEDQPPVDPARRPAHQGRAHVAPGGDPQQDGGQHHGEGVGAVVEREQGEEAEPDHLVAQGAEAGEAEGEQDGHPAGPRPGPAGRARRNPGQGPQAPVAHPGQARGPLRRGRRCRRGGVRVPADEGEQDGQHPYGHVDHGRGHDAGADAVAGDEHEPGGQRPGDGPEGVDGVEHADAAPQRAPLHQRRPEHHRQGGPHQGGGDEQDPEGQQEAHQARQPVRQPAQGAPPAQAAACPSAQPFTAG